MLPLCSMTLLPRHSSNSRKTQGSIKVISSRVLSTGSETQLNSNSPKTLASSTTRILSQRVFSNPNRLVFRMDFSSLRRQDSINSSSSNQTTSNSKTQCSHNRQLSTTHMLRHNRPTTFSVNNHHSNHSRRQEAIILGQLVHNNKPILSNQCPLVQTIRLPAVSDVLNHNRKRPALQPCNRSQNQA